VPSAVGLGVLMNKDNTVKQAGGFIIQLMPFIDEKVVDKLEAKLANVKSVTSMLDAGYTPEMILEELLGEFGLDFTDTMPAQFYCNCDKARVEKAIISVGRKTLNEMVQEGKPIEVACHFCNTKYEFTVEELKDMIKRSK
jgi:molecular chaperone Hsp33